MKDVMDTEYSDNFSEEERGKVFVLSPSESKAVFEKAFGPNVKSFFDFPDNHWLVNAKKISVGHWIEAYNSGAFEHVSALLKNATGWMPEDRLYFFLKRQVVFETRWKHFIASWYAFVASEDDAPIVMRNPNEKTALMFTSLGEIRLISG